MEYKENKKYEQKQVFSLMSLTFILGSIGGFCCGSVVVLVGADILETIITKL